MAKKITVMYARIWRYQVQGLNIYQMAKKFGCSVAEVRKVVRENEFSPCNS